MRIRTGVLLSVAFVLGACASQSVQRDVLFANDWQLVNMQGKAMSMNAERRPPSLLLNADDGRVTGWAGCNRYSADYQLSGESLEIGQIAATKMACDGPAMRMEDQFRQMLGEVVAWRIEEQQLFILDEAEEVLARFRAAPLK